VQKVSALSGVVSQGGNNVPSGVQTQFQAGQRVGEVAPQCLILSRVACGLFLGSAAGRVRVLWVGGRYVRNLHKAVTAPRGGKGNNNGAQAA